VSPVCSAHGYWLPYALVALRSIAPPFTAVQVQRTNPGADQRQARLKHYKFVPLANISHELQHAMVAAEDAGFSSTMASIGTRSGTQ